MAKFSPNQVQHSTQLEEETLYACTALSSAQNKLYAKRQRCNDSIQILLRTSSILFARYLAQ